MIAMPKSSCALGMPMQWTVVCISFVECAVLLIVLSSSDRCYLEFTKSRLRSFNLVLAGASTALINFTDHWSGGVELTLTMYCMSTHDLLLAACNH